jgi:hypothetical protein
MSRSAKITYKDGSVITTSLAAHLTDKEIKEYFKPGKMCNIGSVEDNVQAVVSCEIAPLKGLTVEVYTSCFSGDGISSRVKFITLCGEGLPELFEAKEDRPAFRVVKRNISGQEYTHVEPWEKPEGRGWMYGGNICCTSDSRFPNQYPLKIHDRQEF